MKKTLSGLFPAAIKTAVITAVILALIAATALNLTCCGKDPTNNPSASLSNLVGEGENVQTVGEGQTAFLFSVTFLDGTTQVYTVRTDADTVGKALLGENLIAGDEGPYGLYVKTVCGQTVDYDRDGKYWAFYINGEMAMSGVDTTPVTPNASYAFKAE